MLKFIFLIIIVCVIIALIKSKLHINWHTFFKKGFKKVDNLFGIVCYCAKQRKTAKHIVPLSFAKSKAKKMVMK